MTKKKLPQGPIKRLIDMVLENDGTLSKLQASKAVQIVSNAYEQSGAMSDGLLVCSKGGGLVDDSGDHQR